MNQRIGFGKHAGKSIALLVLKEPDYILWLISKENTNGRMLLAQDEVMKLISIFDHKPFVQKCYGKNCDRTATRCTVSRNAISPYWWCDSCDPYDAGAIEGKLQVIKTYRQAITHVDNYCTIKGAFRSLIREIAKAKGLNHRRVGEAQAERFFL